MKWFLEFTKDWMKRRFFRKIASTNDTHLSLGQMVEGPGQYHLSKDQDSKVDMKVSQRFVQGRMEPNLDNFSQQMQLFSERFNRIDAKLQAMKSKILRMDRK